MQYQHCLRVLPMGRHSAHKGRRGYHQLFGPRHLLQTAVGITLLDRHVDFHQPMCAGYENLKSHSV
jgi:hypothetical protein